MGELELTFDVLAVPGEPGLAITTYTARAGSESEARLKGLRETSS